MSFKSATKPALPDPAVDGKTDDVKGYGTDHVEKLDTKEARGNDYFDSIEQTKPSSAVWRITATVAMGGFLFGKFRP